LYHYMKSKKCNRIFPSRSSNIFGVVRHKILFLGRVKKTISNPLSSNTVRVSFGSCSVKWGFYRRSTEHDPKTIRTNSKKNGVRSKKLRTDFKNFKILRG